MLFRSKMKSSLLEDLSKDILKDVELGECKAWSFTNSRGDTIYGRYYLPPHFDANRKYPMIVNYYGGCSPVSRNFESRYPHHAYAALGYVVYVIEPSGATGFGQEFSARHVNTAGEGVAQDIIEGTKQFCKEHAFVNDKKIGCIGASYGGFMTQYLQTQTDIFAAAISHAGISDHTSYYAFNYVIRVEGKKDERTVFALPKFTIPDDKKLVVEMYEKQGGRHQIFEVDNEDLVRAETINELQVR